MERGREISLKELYAVFRRRYPYFLLTFIIVFTGGTVSTLMKDRIYEATSKIEIGEPSGQKDFLGYLSSLGQARRVDTEMEIIRSSAVIAQVVKQLSLNVTSSSRDLRIYSFSLTPVSPDNPYVVRWKGDEAVIKIPSGGELKVKNDEPFNSGVFSVYLSWDSQSSGTSKVVVRPVEDTVFSVLAHLKVKKASPMSNVLILTYRDTDPVRAMKVLNTLVQVYQQRNREKWSESAEKALEFLERQIEQTRVELEKVESELDSWRKKTGYVELDAEISGIIKRISELETKKVEIEMREREISDLLRTLSASSDSTMATAGISVDDPIVEGLLKKLADLEVQKTALLSQYTELHPQVRLVEARIKETREKILDALRGIKDGLSKQKRSLEKIIRRYDVRLRALPETERLFARLQRKAEVAGEIYTFLLKKGEETRIARAATLGNVRVVDPAYLPRVPVEPKVGLSVATFFLVGVLFGFTVMLLLEHVDDTVRIPDDVKVRFDVPVIGVLPVEDNVESLIRNVNLNKSDERGEERSSFFESVRTLRTNLRYMMESDEAVIMITSPGGNEGKTTVSTALAVTYALAGVKTLLLDADLRRSRGHRILGLPRVPGFTECIIGERSLEEAIKNVRDHLSIITSGQYPPNPSELLQRSVMEDIFSRLRNEYEMIIVDTPPVLAVADTLVLSEYVDKIILILSARQTRLKEFETAMNAFGNISKKVSGVVVNNVRYEDIYPYGYNYAYYYYRQKEKARTAFYGSILSRVEKWLENLRH